MLIQRKIVNRKLGCLCLVESRLLGIFAILLGMLIKLLIFETCPTNMPLCNLFSPKLAPMGLLVSTGPFVKFHAVDDLAIVLCSFAARILSIERCCLGAGLGAGPNNTGPP